jgi:hypothetical protein
MKLTLKSAIIHEPASPRLREKMLIDISRRQPVTIIGIRIAKQNGKYHDNQQQIIWTYCTSWIVLWVIIDKFDGGVFLFFRV